VLSRGLISGHWSKERTDSLGRNDFRSHAPRFSAANVEHNLKLVEELRKIAQSKDATVAQIAIAWVLSRGGDVIPLVGARTRTRLTEALGAATLVLTDEDRSRIEAAIPPGSAAGTRYEERQMAALDSERA